MVAIHAGVLPAQVRRLGSEFKVNSTTIFYGSNQVVSADSQGNFVVIWAVSGAELAPAGLFGQRFQSSGHRIGSEFQVSESAFSYPDYPSVSHSPEGEFVVVWQALVAGLDQVLLRRFAADGAALGREVAVFAETYHHPYDPDISHGAGGDFVVAWTDYYYRNGSQAALVAQRFDDMANPIGAELQLNSFTLGMETQPQLAHGEGGEFVAVWKNRLEGDAEHTGIFGRRYDSLGQPRDTEFRVTGTDEPITGRLEIGLDAADDLLVVWESSICGIAGRWFNGTGSPRTADFCISDPAPCGDNYPAIEPDAAGRFVVIWDRLCPGSDYTRGIYGRKLDRRGLPTGRVFQINDPDHLAARPGLARAGDREFVVVWDREARGAQSAVYGLRFRVQRRP